MNYASDILDEIALEGLDGITINALWLRLANRAHFIFASQVVDDEETQIYLWSIIKRLRNVEFFVLLEPRKSLILKRCYTIDPELGIITETGPTPDDPYPHKLINDTGAGIVGSCHTYDTRKNVSMTVRKLNLNEVIALYKDVLVIVANQDIRRKALISLHVNPNLDVSPIQYCILERIGRSRHYGEPTQGKLGLSALGEDAKTIFYLRKHLLKHNMITKQIYQNKTAANTSGLLLHLPRFYRLVKPRYISLIEKVLKILADEPNHLIDYDLLREKLQGVLKKLTKVVEFQKYFRSDAKIPYRALYPNADVKAWKQKSCDKEKKVRVVELRNPNADIRELQKRLLGTCEEEEEEDDKSGGILDEKNRFIDIPLMVQCCMLLKHRGVDGFSQSEIAREMGFPKVQARTVTKNLVKCGAAGMYMVDQGRQRITKYYLKYCSVINDSHKYLLDKDYATAGKFILNCDTVEPKITPTDDKAESTTATKCDEQLTDNKTSGMDINNLEMILSNVGGNSKVKNPHTSLCTAVKAPTKRKGSNIKSSTSKKKIKLEYDEQNNILSEKPNLKLKANLKLCKETDVDSIQIDTTKVKSLESEAMDVDDNLSISNTLITEVSNEANTAVNDIKENIEVSDETDLNKLNIEVSITDDCFWLLPNTCKNELVKLQSKSLKTFRLLKRSNLVIEAVQKLKVITDLKRLTFLINESEFKEGLSCRMDKKSLLRILFKLALDKHIKVFRVTLKQGSKVIYLSFICRKNVKPDDPIIKSVIEFNKLKFHSVSVPNNKVPYTARKRANITFEKRNSFSHYPKFNRMKVMHRFLFFLVYDYIGNTTLDQHLAKSKIMKEHRMDDGEWNGMPKLYQSKIDEHMFVPPLPKYNEQGQQSGWCLMSDILVRMPLSVFVRLVQIPYHIPELDDYMNHPIKKYYLVSNLPSRIRNCITATRKYIFTIYEAMMKLVYIGLLQFGAHHNKEKDQIFAFVNRKAMLIDTTSSKPGYNKVSTDIDYPVHYYHFESMVTVEEYWHSCWKICMNTRLGGRLLVMGTDVILENIQDKQDMIEALKAREFMEAVNYDNGHIPGDQLGAAGFDSAMYAHLKRNWSIKNKASISYDSACNSKTLQVRKVPQSVSSSNNRSTVRSMKRKSSESMTSNTNVAKKATKKEISSSKDKNTFVVPTSKLNNTKKPRVKVRRINPVKKSLHRKPYYDQVDKEALKRMSKLRVDWSAEEDRILLICKVASAFICSDTRKQVNANMFLAFREVLHKTIQSSKNKTSRACQRRVAYMLRSTSMAHNVNLCIEELKQDEYIIKTYGNTMELIKQEAKLKGKRILELGNIWRERFKCLVNDLMSHYYKNSFNNFSSFSSVFHSKSSNSFVLPDNLAEFNDKYYLQQIERKNYKPKDILTPVSTLSDIYSAVINSTIHSTLSCNSDKISWSYHLFSIYQQYPERILRNTLSRLRENQMVSFKKSYQVRNRTGNNYYLPLSASPYQLSISYVNLIQTKYQSNLYLDCCATVSELLQTCNASVPNKMYISKGYEVLSRTGGTTAAIIELFSDNAIQFFIDIPNQVIILDPNIQNKDETYSRMVQRYKLFLSKYKKDLTSSVLFQKHNYMSCDVTSSDNRSDEIDDIGEPEDETKTSEQDQTSTSTNNTRAIQNVAKAASRIALYMMNDNKGSSTGMVPKELDHVYDFFVVNSCKVFIKVIRPLNTFTTKKSCSSLVDVTSCNIIDETTIKAILQSLRNSAVFCNISPLQYNLSQELDSQAINDDDDDDDDDNSFNIKEYDEAVLEKIINCNFVDNDIILVKSMLAMMINKKEFGLTSPELIKEFGNSFKTLNIIDKLVDMYFVLKTGVVHSRYVYYSFARPWLLHSYRNLRCDKDARVPLHKLKHFQVKEKHYNFEEICSDDDIEDTGSSIDLPSTSRTVVESNSNNESKEKPKVDNIIDDTRWCMEKANLEKLTMHKMSEPVRVVMRPWIRVDGTLNRRVLDAMLSSILSHIMLYPGLTLLNIQCRFSPGYQPQQIRELCEILSKLNCVNRYCVTTKTKPSLFSKPGNISIEPSTGLESANDIRFESNKFAIINLGKFLETRPYTKDFVTCLLGK